MALLQGKGWIARFAVFLFIMFLSWPKCYAKIISSARWWVGSWQLNKTLFLSMKDEDKKWISLFQRQDALQGRKVQRFIANMRVLSRAHICTEQTRWLSFCALHCQRRWCIFACSRHSWVYVIKNVRASRVTHTDQPQRWNIGEVSDVLAHLGLSARLCSLAVGRVTDNTSCRLNFELDSIWGLWRAGEQTTLSPSPEGDRWYWGTPSFLTNTTLLITKVRVGFLLYSQWKRAHKFSFEHILALGKDFYLGGWMLL